MKNSRTLTAAAAVLGLTGSLILAGCSSSSLGLGDPTATASPPAAAASSPPSSRVTASGACSLITQQEATAALGMDPGPGVENADGIATTCTFGAPPSIVTVAFMPSGGSVAYDHALVLAQAHPLAMINGVGNAAFSTFSGPIGSISFHKGDALVSILLSIAGTGAPSQDTLTALGKRAAGRL